KMRKVELTHLFITTLRAANTPIGMANTAPRKVEAKALSKLSTISRTISAEKPPDDGDKNSARVAGSSVSPTRNSRRERSTANQDSTVKITIVAITSTRLTRSALHGGLMLIAGAATATSVLSSFVAKSLSDQVWRQLGLLDVRFMMAARRAPDSSSTAIHSSRTTIASAMPRW